MQTFCANYSAFRVFDEGMEYRVISKKVVVVKMRSKIIFKHRNSKGPRTLPCGTPVVRALGLEINPSSNDSKLK